MKKIILAIMAVCLLMTVTACSGGEQDWNGTFYNTLDENHTLAFTFEHDGSNEDIYGAETEITTNSGIGKSSVSISAWLKNKNTAEDNRGYRYTLKGDTLTVEYIEDDEVFGTDFSGTYTRGASIEETFNIDSHDETISTDSNSMVSSGDSIIFNEFYYQDGNPDEVSLYFYDDGTVDMDGLNGTTETDEYDYVIEDDKVILSENGSEKYRYTIIDAHTLTYETGEYQFMMLDASGLTDNDSSPSNGTTASWIYYLDGDLASEDYFKFNDDASTDVEGEATGMWCVSGVESNFTYKVLDDSILIELAGMEIKLQSVDENSLYWEETDSNYKLLTE